MRLSNPTDRNTEARIVVIEGVSLYFSYETLVAVRGNNGMRRNSEDYSVTTRKHMREMGIDRMPNMDHKELRRYAEVSIMTSLMEKYLPVKETDNET